jgi:hypothetical protein
MGYQPKTYRDDGGDTLVIASGGTIDINQGAYIKDTSKGVSADRIVVVEKAALAAVSGAGKVLSWTAPTGSNIMIHRLVLDITTAGVTGCVLNAGTTSASATTSSDNLIDGLVATGAAGVGVFDNTEDGGTNGKGARKLTAGKWLTISSAAKAASLAGNAYIYYITV